MLLLFALLFITIGNADIQVFLYGPKKRLLPSFTNRAFFFFLRSTKNFLLSRLIEMVNQLLLKFSSIHGVEKAQRRKNHNLPVPLGFFKC